MADKKKNQENSLEVPGFLKTKQSVKVEKISFRQAPIPTPEELAGYENICSGSADRIIQMAEEQGNHRRAQEQRAVKAAIIDGHLGLCFAFILSIMGFSLGYLLIQSDHMIAGTIFSGISFLSIIKAFISTPQKNNK